MKTLKIIIIALLVACYSCGDSEAPEPTFKTELTKITSKTENGIKVTLFASKDFFVGYNAVTAKIEDKSGKLLKGNISVKPMMKMRTMSHACPIEFPDGGTFKNGTYQFNPVFVMPSGEMDSWRIEFTINGKQVKVPINVSAPKKARLVSFQSMTYAKTKYFVAFIDPKKPKVGRNDLEIAVYKRQSMMKWPAVTGMKFELKPWMVSMDHGSPNNVAPAHTKNGHYKGTVNFTMTGDWQVRLTMKDGNDKVCGKPYFDLYFQ